MLFPFLGEATFRGRLLSRIGLVLSDEIIFENSLRDYNANFIDLASSPTLLMRFFIAFGCIFFGQNELYQEWL